MQAQSAIDHANPEPILSVPERLGDFHLRRPIGRGGMGQIYEAIQAELRSQYNVGFVSDQPVEISEFRALKLTTKQKGLIVQSRERYWAQA